MDDKTVFIKKIISVLLGAGFIYLCALMTFDLPGSTIPQTAQTFGVLVIAALLGQLAGFASVVLYLLVGMLGLPVFADGTMGLEVLMGPTKGYLFGFVFATLLCSWWFSLSKIKSITNTFIIMLSSHLLILLMGWLWLASILGAEDALYQGVSPFIYGALAKSLAASLFVVGYFNFFESGKNKEFS